MTFTPPMFIPSMLMYSWESQVWQYPQKDSPGVHYYPGVLPDGRVVDCLLWYGSDRKLHGILNHYDEAFCHPGSPEKPGNVNLWVDPAWQRMGIGTALVKDAMRRWDLDPEQQQYSTQGWALVQSLGVMDATP
jgi:GNAT superfamily N-acetyltransferase